MPTRMHDHEVDIDEALVHRLLAAQMPDLASLPLTIVEPWGTDNAVWRLGEDLVVRLPRIDGAQGQVDKEAAWLPKIAPHVSVAVPVPVGVGEPDFGYPYRWAVHRAIEGAAHLIDADAAFGVWEDALAAPECDGPLVWVQGDLEGNCLVADGRLCGIVDWNSACLGDPAVDVQVVWSPLFTDESRAVFLDALDVDDATIRRSKGAAINQACAALPYYLTTYPLIVERSWHKLAALGIAPLAGR